MTYQYAPPNGQAEESQLEQMDFDNLQQIVLVLTALEISGSDQTLGST